MLTKSSRWIASIEDGLSNAEDLNTDGQSAVDVPGIVGPRCLQEGSPPPDLAAIKDFIRFKASISQGRIDKTLELATTNSLNAFAEWFFAGFARVTGNPIPEEDRKEVFSVNALEVGQYDPC